MVNNNNNLGRIIFIEAEIGKTLQEERADEIKRGALEGKTDSDIAKELTSDYPKWKLIVLTKAVHFALKGYDNLQTYDVDSYEGLLSSEELKIAEQIKENRRRIKISDCAKNRHYYRTPARERSIEKLLQAAGQTRWSKREYDHAITLSSAKDSLRLTYRDIASILNHHYHHDKDVRTADGLSATLKRRERKISA